MKEITDFDTQKMHMQMHGKTNFRDVIKYREMLRNRRIVNRGQGIGDHGQFEKEEEVFGPDGAVPVYRKAVKKWNP